METFKEKFEIIETMRNENRFSAKNYVGYKNYLKVKLRDAEKRKMGVYKLESNVCKSLMLKSVKFLKNNLHILKKDTSEFGKMYRDLMKGMIGAGDVEAGVFMSLRERLVEFKSFLNQINGILEHAPYNVDTSMLKVKEMWHDVELRFDTDAERKAFHEGVVFEGRGYDAEVARRVKKIEKAKRKLFVLIEKRPTKVLCIGKKAQVLQSELEGLKMFLGENLVESKYINKVLEDTKSLCMYYAKIYEFIVFLKNDEMIDAFVVPTMFKNLELQIVQAREDFSKVPKKYLKAELMKQLEESLIPKEPVIKMPFVPVIFDIARDYISYPPDDKKLSELFKQLSMSND
ncbi:hypothetical protein CWI42_051840 [Ordospora colligata]|uniref:Uncharacterized protein n=1 Tax=Ordospora colligata OC4 TaxID=1354746 RepID=A0A0B2ULE8_9MICR|nr:uncharacterized protein M896_051890 [Ordospora colligata OC4]KHN69780.1 hypothetical protein M896_051890 [Ordospora colligata OC4]TBU15583.1 hypothetical protein CWI41_051880 [Ordospora colligata]TBU15650.1 hypothetical protein CWI40_051860 [Ordospora colligata]TBU18701.1 hypothetical protein CWI42_051840 [Ordospora colligata]